MSSGATAVLTSGSQRVSRREDWKRVERFRDVEVGQYVRLVRPMTDLAVFYKFQPGDSWNEEDGEQIIPRAAYEGLVERVNPRGELHLSGHRSSFLEDSTFGEWFFEVYVLQLVETEPMSVAAEKVGS